MLIFAFENCKSSEELFYEFEFYGLYDLLILDLFNLKLYKNKLY